MAPMTGAFDLRTTAGWLRFVGLLEAVSWVGLLTGMYFKYLGSPQTEIGVKIFGPIHGGVFVAFVVAAIVAGIAFAWRPGTWLLAMVASIVPLGTVIFLIWAEKAGRMSRSGVAPMVARPGRTVTETT
ncbi:DUF3817 domain-containing protein [Mycolicibacterium sp. S2-37]|uniref:DUF3817 domain-containing protein n=1 Tax=Mycolicibacterium sp. S2-37 TaxID=2810297 RepID=UPI001A951B43|nr:DUF3817 domain-containing protein [Mycolicibacterium sp. S2-37]MBO0677909.1 DUF3817 domain-containing protein [Mycolicibacterium sp. S2-37]